MTEHWVFSDQSTYLWEVIFSFPTYWKCFKASLESNSMKNKMVYTTKPNYKYESMKTKWSTHDIVFSMPRRFGDVRYKGVLRFAATKSLLGLTSCQVWPLAVLASTTIACESRGVRKITFAISNAGVMVQRSLSQITQTIPNETCISFSQLAGQIQPWKTLKKKTA